MKINFSPFPLIHNYVNGKLLAFILITIGRMKKEEFIVKPIPFDDYFPSEHLIFRFLYFVGQKESSKCVFLIVASSQQHQVDVVSCINNAHPTINRGKRKKKMGKKPKQTTCWLIQTNNLSTFTNISYICFHFICFLFFAHLKISVFLYFSVVAEGYPQVKYYPENPNIFWISIWNNVRFLQISFKHWTIDSNNPARALEWSKLQRCRNQ